MNAREQIGGTGVQELLEASGPCITVALAGDQFGDTATELKNALAEIQKMLRERKTEPGLTNAIAAVGAEVRGETKSRGSIVILRSPAILQVHRVHSIRPVVRVGDHFDLRTLLAIVAGQRSFYILALSQNRTRILRCTQDSSEEIPFPAGYPSSLAEAMQTDRPDHNLKNRWSAGPSVGQGAVVFGTSSDMDDKDEYLLHFFMDLDKAVNAALKGSSDPLIIAGVEHEIALYRRVNTYPQLVEPGIHGAPDGLEGGEMHRRAIELLDERKQPPELLPGNFDNRVGKGLASTHIQDIVTAAFQGRASHLYFQENARYSGVYDAARQRVKHTDDPLDSPVDLIEAAAYETLLQGGEAAMLSGSAMPGGVPICALFRYALPQPAAEPQPVEASSQASRPI